jgi:nucleoside-diphosphate-sugar epimerase
MQTAVINQKQKAVISGSSGFIGQHIMRLLKDKYTFVPITQELLYSPDNLAEFFKTEKPDVIFNLAAYGNHASQDNPAMTVFANIIGTFNILYASLQTPYTKFVQFGSSSEYGKKTYSMSESDICDPETFYGASKLGATYLARTFAKQYGKPIIIIRPFSVYGEGEAEFRFIPTVIRKLLTGETMELETDGKHDWIYIEDFISGVELAIQKGLPGQIVNIGTGREITNLNVVTALQNVSGRTLKYTEKKFRLHDSVKWAADITLLMGWGWRAKYPLALGLGKTLQWYKANEQQKS